MEDCAEVSLEFQTLRFLLPPYDFALRRAIQEILRSKNGEVKGTLELGLVEQAESLIKSLKGVRDARVHADADDRITRVDLVCVPGEERAAGRNVHSALIAVFGITLPVGSLNFP